MDSSIGYCLSAGNYKFTINDKFKDGMNGGNGGSYAGYVAGIKKFGSPSGETEWGQRVHEFSVTTSNGNSISAQQLTAKNDDGMTERDLLWLTGHNTRRKEWHTRHGKSYVPLQWSNALKAQAKIYAKELVYLCGGELIHGEKKINVSVFDILIYFNDINDLNIPTLRLILLIIVILRQHSIRRKSGC